MDGPVIICIGDNPYHTTPSDHLGRRDATYRVSTVRTQKQTEDEDPTTSSEPKNKFGPQAKNLSSIIRGIKSAVTTQARRIDPEFGWQARFHERLIRDHYAFERATYYIRNHRGGG